MAARLAAGIDPRTDAARHAPTPRDGLHSRVVRAGRRRVGRRGRLDHEPPARARRLAVATSPGGGDAFVARIAMLIPSEWPPALRIVAIDADSGERVVFDAASGVPLARAVAASRAVPGLLPPITIGERRFIDGALGSATNADAAGPDAIVIAPFPRFAAGGVEALWSEALRAELDQLPDALVIDAGAEALGTLGTPLAVAAGRARARSDQPAARRVGDRGGA